MTAPTVSNQILTGAWGRVNRKLPPPIKGALSRIHDGKMLKNEEIWDMIIKTTAMVAANEMLVDRCV